MTATGPTLFRSSQAVARRGLIRTIRFPAIIVQSFFFPGFFLVVYVDLAFLGNDGVREFD